LKPNYKCFCSRCYW